MERGRGEGRRGGGYEEFYSIPSLSLSLSSFFLFSFPLSFFSSVLFFLPFLFYPLFFFSLPFFVFSSPSLFFNILRETPMRESIDFESIKRLFLLTAKPILFPFHFPLPPFVRRSGRQKRNNSATREFRSNGKEKLSPPSPPSERKKSRQLYFHQLHRPMFLLLLPSPLPPTPLLLLADASFIPTRRRLREHLYAFEKGGEGRIEFDSNREIAAEFQTSVKILRFVPLRSARAHATT